MSDKKPVRFIRVRGRIVPIRIKEAGAVAGGTAVAAYGGYLASKAVRASALTENAAHDLAKRVFKAKQLQFPGISTGTRKVAEDVASQVVAKKELISNALFKSRSALIVGGAALGAGLIYKGVATKSKQDQAKAKKFAVAAPVAAAFSYYYPLNRKLIPTVKYTFKKAKDLIKVIK